jgi:hypothetical protein
MPGFDGKGRWARGPITGSGPGILHHQEPASGKEEATGFAGLSGQPVGESSTPAETEKTESKNRPPGFRQKARRFLYLNAASDLIAPVPCPAAGAADRSGCVADFHLPNLNH